MMKHFYYYLAISLSGALWVCDVRAAPEQETHQEDADHDTPVLPAPVYAPYPPAYMAMHPAMNPAMNPYAPYAGYYPPAVGPYAPPPYPMPNPYQQPPVSFSERKPKNLDAKYKGKMWAGGAVTQTLANTLGRNAVLSGNQNMASIASAVQDVGQVMSLMNQMRGKNGSFSGDKKKSNKNQPQNGKPGQGGNQQNQNIQNTPVNLPAQRAFGTITRNNQIAPVAEKPKSAQEALQEGKRVNGKITEGDKKPGF